MIKVYNTLTREKQPFVPIEPGTARMYVCGMTVYDYCHLGHARVMVVFDVIARWLRASGYRVTYVRNITDIDDKIIARAAENGEPIGSLTARFIDAMHEDAQALGVAMPDLEPRATEYVDAMVAMISTLIAKGLAYVAKNGDVYYAVHNFPGYGKLSGKTLDELKAGERVEVEPAKRDPLDFALWKAAKPGEPAWEAPWGPGRPGWHIECSVMSTVLLGPHFDIHGGGQDLQFPHHENEIAQSEGAHAVPFVNYWLHNGFVRVDNEKMSKSLGNFFTVREVLARYHPEVVRFFMLRAHYRSPLNYSDQHLEDAKHALEGFYLALRGMSGEALPVAWDNSFAARFKAAMNDDFDTHGAITVLFELAHELNKSKSKRDADLLKSLGAMLGLFQQNPEDYLQGARMAVSSPAATRLSSEQIDALIAQRSAARKARDFGEADRIRAQLSDAGVLLEDGPGGTVWRRA